MVFIQFGKGSGKVIEIEHRHLKRQWKNRIIQERIKHLNLHVTKRFNPF